MLNTAQRIEMYLLHIIILSERSATGTWNGRLCVTVLDPRNNKALKTLQCVCALTELQPIHAA